MEMPEEFATQIQESGTSEETSISFNLSKSFNNSIIWFLEGAADITGAHHCLSSNYLKLLAIEISGMGARWASLGKATMQGDFKSQAIYHKGMSTPLPTIALTLKMNT